MLDAYYIVSTVVFGLFVIFIAWLLYSNLRKPDTVEDPVVDEREIIDRYCAQR